MKRKGVLLSAAVGVAMAIVAAGIAATVSTGPSSSHPPYVQPAREDVKVVSILSVGDNVPGTDGDGPGYQMVGIADGLAALAGSRPKGRHDGRGDGDNGRHLGRTFTVLMNHELPGGTGIVREHGANASFVSRWTIDRKTLRVLHGEDLIEQVALAPGGVYAPPAKGVVIQRLCSGDLPDQSAFYNRKTGRGYAGPLFLSGEEVGPNGRAFAHAMDGTSYELPYLGKMSWENAVAQPGSGDLTVVMNMDDATPGQVYVYIGRKQRQGNPAEQAGLTNGKLYGIVVDGYPVEPDTGIPSGTPIRVREIKNQQTRTGTDIEAESLASPITEFKRPEDGAWDPNRNRDYYWVTTDRPREAGGSSRLWRFNLRDLSSVEDGDAIGTIDMLLQGSEGQEMLDNMTVDDYGRILLQEDPGNDPNMSKIWSYDIEDDELTQLTDQLETFATASDNPAYDAYTALDEETSGIIPADHVLGKGWYLFDSQIHNRTFEKNPALAQKLVEKGQLLALYYPVEDEEEDEGDEDEDD